MNYCTYLSECGGVFIRNQMSIGLIYSVVYWKHKEESLLMFMTFKLCKRIPESTSCPLTPCTRPPLSPPARVPICILIVNPPLVSRFG